MQAGEQIIAPSRDEAVRRSAGTLTVERYAVPVFERERPVPAGAGVRLTRMDVEPSDVDDAVEVFGDTAVPLLAETGGCRSILYLVDYISGRTISESIWTDAAAMAASRSAAAAARVEAATAAGGVVRTVEEYSVAFSSARAE
jgi:quinol monooxygenase YgiN